MVAAHSRAGAVQQVDQAGAVEVPLHERDAVRADEVAAADGESI